MDERFEEFLASLILDEELEKECPYKQMSSKEATKALRQFWGIEGEKDG